MAHVERFETSGETARRYGVTPRTLARWRADGIGPLWLRVGRSIRYPVQTVPGEITVLSPAPLGELGQVLPDPHSPWRVLVDQQRLEPADEGGEPHWLSTLRIASTAERDRALAGYRKLLDAIRETPADGEAA